MNELIGGPGRTASLIVFFAMFALASCDEEDPAADPEVCVCIEGECPETVCEVAFTLPETCTESASVTVAGTPTRAALPGEAYSSCSVTLDERAASTVALSGPVDAQGTATCRTAGGAVAPDFCTLRFELSDTCGEIPGRETADVLIAGEVVGQTAVDDPLVPCLVVSAGDSVEGTIRSGTDLVLTNTFNCRPPGGQLSLVLECQ